MNNKIAIYLRLSLSDGDLKKGSKDESNSIENQRLLLHSYIEKQDDLPGEIVEYVDICQGNTAFDNQKNRKAVRCRSFLQRCSWYFLFRNLNYLPMRTNRLWLRKR